jgi:hypothetical protein
MDGKHVIIRCPPKSGSDYFKYKKDFSIMLFAIVDSHSNFLYIDVGTNGRANGASLFSKSALNEALQQNRLNIPADDAFPLQTNILKPYTRATALNKSQLVFNCRLSRGLRVVENSFGISVARFRVFEKPIPLSVATTEQIVKTNCLLHNWLRKTSTSFQSYVEQEFMDSENWNQGKVIPGQWRTLRNDGLIDVSTPLSSNNHTRNAAEVRDSYANMFVTTDTVPWQWNMI